MYIQVYKLVTYTIYMYINIHYSRWKSK